MQPFLTFDMGTICASTAVLNSLNLFLELVLQV